MPRVINYAACTYTAAVRSIHEHVDVTISQSALVRAQPSRGPISVSIGRPKLHHATSATPGGRSQPHPRRDSAQRQPALAGRLHGLPRPRPSLHIPLGLTRPANARGYTKHTRPVCSAPTPKPSSPKQRHRQLWSLTFAIHRQDPPHSRLRHLQPQPSL